MLERIIVDLLVGSDVKWDTWNGMGKVSNQWAILRQEM